MFFRLIRLSVPLSLSELKEKSLIRNDPDKSEFTVRAFLSHFSENEIFLSFFFWFRVAPLHSS